MDRLALFSLSLSGASDIIDKVDSISILFLHKFYNRFFFFLCSTIQEEFILLVYHNDIKISYACIEMFSSAKIPANILSS